MGKLAFICAINRPLIFVPVLYICHLILKVRGHSNL